MSFNRKTAQSETRRVTSRSRRYFDSSLCHVVRCYNKCERTARRLTIAREESRCCANNVGDLRGSIPRSETACRLSPGTNSSTGEE